MLGLAFIAACCIITGIALFVTADSPFDTRGVLGLILYVGGFMFPLILV